MRCRASSVALLKGSLSPLSSTLALLCPILTPLLSLLLFSFVSLLTLFILFTLLSFPLLSSFTLLSSFFVQNPLTLPELSSSLLLVDIFASMLSSSSIASVIIFLRPLHSLQRISLPLLEPAFLFSASHSHLTFI